MSRIPPPQQPDWVNTPRVRSLNSFGYDEVVLEENTRGPFATRIYRVHLTRPGERVLIEVDSASVLAAWLGGGEVHGYVRRELTNDRNNLKRAMTSGAQQAVDLGIIEEPPRADSIFEPPVTRRRIERARIAPVQKVEDEPSESLPGEPMRKIIV